MKLNLLRWTHTCLVCAAAVCLTGCQTISSWMPQHDKVTDARQNATAKDTTPTPDITPAQKLNVQLAVARSMEDENHGDQAAKLYIDVTKKDPQNVVAFQRLGLLYAKQGQWDLSQKNFESAIKLAPKNAELQCDLGYAFYLQHRDQEAQDFFRRAIALDGDFYRAHNDLGLVLARRGNEIEALKEFAKAGCNEAQAHANLALAYSLENRIEDARTQYRVALANDPNLVVAKSGIKALDKVDATIAKQVPAIEQPQLTSHGAIGVF